MKQKSATIALHKSTFAEQQEYRTVLQGTRKKRHNKINKKQKICGTKRANRSGIELLSTLAREGFLKLPRGLNSGDNMGCSCPFTRADTLRCV